MKIIFILPGVPRDISGGMKVIIEYTNYLLQKGYNIEFRYFLVRRNKNFIVNGIHKILSYIKALLNHKTSLEIDARVKTSVELIRINNVADNDVVVATEVNTAQYVAKCKNGKKAYFIQDFENWHCTDEYVYKTYNMGMTNIVVSNWLKNIVDNHSSSPSYLVSNCINTNVFYDKNLNRRKHSIVFHYRIAKHKGSEYAIEAIKQLENKYDDLTVDIISTENEPENLPKSCIYHHSISAEEIASINNITEIFICSTINEGFGLPGLEAMACGCAVVSTSYQGVLEYAVDGENALLSPIRDVDAMVKNVVRLFEDDELRKKIAENGIKTGEKRSLEKSAKEFERILLEK